ncbi:heterokaryon incompatibility protein-domain-containing protein [Coniella lustricola]|uniref:Heterokaryon incompatibility protein-domain-containing protein n=1 Tax=Coniella lustricola TaxID=2025994 RepID=A0A2T3AE58_9PEZI|nr:heterokaryon incompatibility protein-domain-containing protein [Coniella lustricola]
MSAVCSAGRPTQSGRIHLLPFLSPIEYRSRRNGYTNVSLYKDIPSGSHTIQRTCGLPRSFSCTCNRISSSPVAPMAPNLYKKFKSLRMTDIKVLYPPKSQLCAGCEGFKWPALPLAVKGYISEAPHPTFRELQESADQGCIFCQFLWSAIIRHSKISKQVVAGYLNGVRLTCDVRPQGPRGINVYVQLIGEAAAVQDERFIRFPIVDGDKPKALKSIQARHIKRFSPGSISEDLDTLVNDEIRPWLNRCLEQHGEDHSKCQPLVDKKILPTRLVDVGTSAAANIKIVETTNPETTINSPYLILSYCWGQGNTSAMTTSTNLNDRLQGFPIASLPQTVQDAITVTRKLGFQYIWIDAMCIVQAAHGVPGDFSTEAIRMGEYYSNAECCIAASLAADSSQGFLTERLLGRYPIQPIAIQLSSSSLSFTTPAATTIPPDSDHKINNENSYKASEAVILIAEEADFNMEDVLNNTPLMKRGWYLQELMLSRRIIHWTMHGIFLQCSSSTFLEGQMEAWTGNPFSFNPRDILALPNDMMISYKGWYQLLASFSSQALTFESDRLYAIHGVASLLVKQLGMEYYNGLFRPHLAQGLMWYIYGQQMPPAPPSSTQAQHESLRIGAAKQENLFPTWCWASNCPVQFVSIDETTVFIRDDHPRRPRHFPTHPGHLALDNKDNPLDLGALFLRAPLIQVEIKPDEGTMGVAIMAVKNKNKHKHNVEASERQAIHVKYSCMQDYNLQVEGFPTPHRPEQSCSKEFGDSVVVTWLPIGALKQNPPIEGAFKGLLVHRTAESNEEDTYRRCGTLDIYWPSKTDIKLEDCFDDLAEIVLR